LPLSNSITQMKKLLLFTISCLIVFITQAQTEYKGPIPKIADGYGSPGAYTPKTINFEVLPNWDVYYTDEKALASITIPEELNEKAPIVFYIPWDSDSRLSPSTFYSINKERAERIASQGYCYVTLQYNNPGELNDSDPFGLCKATLDQLIDSFSQYVDTTRVGIIGSFMGGGARAIQVASEKFIYENWGENGRFLITDHSGPAIVGGAWEESGKPVFTNEALDAFPDDMKYISIVGDLTHWFDPSFSIDFYEHIGVPDSNKAFFEIASDTLDGHIYFASEVMNMTNTQFVNDTWAKYVMYDAYDEYVYYRTIDALGNLLWKNDYNARNYCLGGDENGNIPMADGLLKPIHSTDNPDPDRYWYAKARGSYVYPCWSVPWNLRKYYTNWPCHGVMDRVDLVESDFSFYPNPVGDIQEIQFDFQWVNSIQSIDIYNSTGQLLSSIQEPTTNKIPIDKWSTDHLLIFCVNWKNAQTTFSKIITNN